MSRRASRSRTPPPTAAAAPPAEASPSPCRRRRADMALGLASSQRSHGLGRDLGGTEDKGLGHRYDLAARGMEVWFSVAIDDG
nr:unnamed protein product [Digitaria exilis]